MIQLFPERSEQGKLRFTHAHGASLFLGLLGAAGALASWLLMPDSPVRLVFTAGLGAAGVNFLIGSLRRYELIIDPARRTWRRRAGYLPRLRTTTGSLDELAGVALELRQIQSGSGSHRRSVPIWSVSLEFTGPYWDGTPLVIGLVQEDEPRAYRLLEHYATKLRATAIDRTAQDPMGRAWDRLDAPVTTPEPTRGRAMTTPPDDSGIEVTREGDATRILLPRYGLGAGSIVAIGFCGIFALFGAAFAISGAGFGPFAQTPLQPITIGVGAVFVVVALRGIASAISRARAREWVIDSGDTMRFGITRDGKVASVTELPKQAIEEVSIRRPTHGGGRLLVFGVNVRLGTPPLIRVRTDTDIVRLGRRLPHPAREWLRDTIAAAAGVPAG